MLAHIGIYVENLKESDDFYRPLLKAIDIGVIFELPQCVAYGVHGDPYFEIYTGKPKSSPIHIAFRVKDKKGVDHFYQVGLTLGARDNGQSGMGKWGDLAYYAAFLIDVNGHNLEVLST